MRRKINHLIIKDIEVFLPMPVFPIVEDVGWWQGEDGSASSQPYRNGFPRRHCLADYQALVRFADRLGIRIGLGMVLCEWDRNNVLRDVPGATWMGRKWDNRTNTGPWLDEAAEFLHDSRDFLELGLHALCHEFWNKGNLERSEFHDQHSTMRSPEVIRSHLDAFGFIFEQNGFSEFPRLFFPPALNHSFGNGEESIQAILYQYGIRYVITRFARARQFTAPHHSMMTWECGVGLMERGIAPISWDVPASPPTWDFSGPILPLHWGNLLHPDPERNHEIIDGWAEMLLAGTTGPEYVLAENFDDCWRQAAVYSFGRLSLDDRSVDIDLSERPGDMPCCPGPFTLTIRGDYPVALNIQGGRLVSDRSVEGNIRRVKILPFTGGAGIRLQLP